MTMADTNFYNIELKDMVEIVTTEQGKARIRVVCYYDSHVDRDNTEAEYKAVSKYLNTRKLLTKEKIQLADNSFDIEVKNSAKGEIQVSVKGTEKVAETFAAEMKKAVKQINEESNQ